MIIELWSYCKGTTSSCSYILAILATIYTNWDSAYNKNVCEQEGFATFHLLPFRTWIAFGKWIVSWVSDLCCMFITFLLGFQQMLNYMNLPVNVVCVEHCATRW
jgi:hypothetical protein